MKMDKPYPTHERKQTNQINNKTYKIDCFKHENAPRVSVVHFFRCVFLQKFSELVPPFDKSIC